MQGGLGHYLVNCVKGDIGNIFDFEDFTISVVITQLLLKYKKSLRQYVNEWVESCPNKTLLTDTKL